MRSRVCGFITIVLLFTFIVGCQTNVIDLDSPTNLRIEGHFILFDEVKDASYYELTILDENNLELSTIRITNNYDLEALNVQAGQYFLKIRAVFQKDKDIIISNYSEKITYTKENTVENHIVIDALGKIGDKITVNTIFKWTNPHHDPSFTLTLVDELDNILLNDITNETELQLDFILSPQTTYILSVEGSESKNKVQKEFMTYGTKEDIVFNPLSSALTISEPYKNSMVIQRNEYIHVSGITESHILVKVSIGDNSAVTVSNDKGAYEVNLPPMIENSQGQTLFVQIAKNKMIEIQDVLIGDVYLVSGQSNMQMSLRDTDYQEQDIQNALDNQVRFYSQDTNTSNQEIDTIKNGKWFQINQIDQGYTYYSAIGFMVGSMLSEALKDEQIPIGIIYAAQGDTNIVNWMSKDYYDGQIQTKNMHYNAMIYPLRHTKLSGVVWYQGCNNSSKGISYRELLSTFFDNWRSLFHNEELPFYVVQLPVYDGDAGNNFDFSYVREAQYLASLDNQNVYLIATADGGDPNNIHPRDKRYISERLTKSILSTIYQKDYLPQGPMYKEHSIEDNKVILSLYYSDGLYADGNIVGFEIAGIDGKYYHAIASIHGENIIIESSHVENPQYIRYGFQKSPFLNVYNKDGFILSPFRTDDYNLNINLLEYDDLSQYKIHQSGSLMTVEKTNFESETVLYVTKQNDGKSFGSLILNKYGAIGNEPIGFKLKVVGTNSNARILFRMVEGSYEIWAYSFIDNFTGVKELFITTSDFICVYNKQDGKIDFEAIMSLELTIESQRSAVIGVIDAMFIEVEKGEPISFMIENMIQSEENLYLTFTKSVFSDYYDVLISEDGLNYTNPIEEYRTTEISATFIITEEYQMGKPYYVKVTAVNEFGETSATNSGFVFYIKSDDVIIINNFDFVDNESLVAYVSSNMIVHAGLELSLDEKGIKIISKGQGWQNFIFKFEKGINQGYFNLEFYADFSSYQGDVFIELVDAYYQIFSYKLDLSEKNQGQFVIELSQFISKSDATNFDGRDLIWIGFNFNDTLGGIIYFDDCQLTQ
jgi:sialate O-acetylesterase